MRLSLSLIILLQFFISEGVFATTSTAQPVDHQEKQTNIPAEVNAGITRHTNRLSLRTVRVGLYENKPKIFTDASGEASGIFPAILQEIARKENWQLTYVRCEWSACLKALEERRIDLMPDVAASAKRREKVDFHSEEVVSSWSTIFSNKGGEFTKIADLHGQRLAVLRDSIQEKYLQRLLNGLGFQASFITVDSFKEAFRLTAEGNADAAVTNYFFG
ncbi:MAG: hypothetical protein D3910_28515, partial [Candidatus Electrothrix sp. ATG2]|nr:hypothetical protein [Candidatus Electrothrix sp. ATG2]